jgi:molybdopterin molybdotransferase
MSTHGGFFDVRMRGFRDRADVDAVQALLRERVRPLFSESVPLAEAGGRVLAEAVGAAVSVPPFARAAMDGYALHAEATYGASEYNPLELRVVGESLPGGPFRGSVGGDEAVRIMTGAPLPDGADAVLQAEAAEERGGKVRVTEPTSPGRHVGRVGEDVAAGATVLHAGRVLRPQDLGLLAAIGVGSMAAVQRPRVAIFVTGDELVPPGAVPGPFQIVDCNSVMLAQLVCADVAIPLPTRHLRDDADAIRRTLSEAAADAVLVCGGTSVGREDHAPRIVAELGELAVHGVALRPASPTGVGFLGGRPVFLLPGNPVSCLCAYDLFAGMAVRLLGGRSPELPHGRVELPLAAKIASALGRVDYVRVRVVDGRVEPLAIGGASILSSTVRADGFVLVDRDREGHAPGERVTVHLYDERRS